MYRNHTIKVTGKKQTDGAVVMGNKGHEHLSRHQIQIEVSAQPAAGTLKIEYLTPGATEYVEATGSPVNLTVLNKAACYRLDSLFAQAFRVTPTDLDADKTYSVIVESNE